LLMDWLKRQVVGKLAKSTVDSYKVNIEKHVIPLLGRIPVQKLRRQDIESFYAMKLEDGSMNRKKSETSKGEKKGLSPRSITHIHRNLCKALGIGDSTVDHIVSLTDNRSTLTRKRFKKNWARLIQKVYDVGPLSCPGCGGKMRIISFVEEEAVIKKILSHLNLWLPQYHDPPDYPDYPGSLDYEDNNLSPATSSEASHGTVFPDFEMKVRTGGVSS
jgi:hypothetical protein